MLVAKSNSFQRAEKIVVTLHGYGADGEDFLEVVKNAFCHKMNNTLFVFPDAPHKCDADFGLEWFKLSNNITFEEIRNGLDKAAPKLFNDVIVNLSEEFNIPTEKINIIGFSQGAMLAFEMLYYGNFSHIVGYSGFFALDPKKEAKYGENKILIVHSDDDVVVPYNNMKMTSDSLNILGIRHETFTCHGIGHSISKEGFEKGLEFILKS